jgi:hypothetical protein
VDANQAGEDFERTPPVAERSFSLRWIWRWRSVAGQVLEFDRLVTVARSDRLADTRPRLPPMHWRAAARLVGADCWRGDPAGDRAFAPWRRRTASGTFAT